MDTNHDFFQHANSVPALMGVFSETVSCLMIASERRPYRHLDEHRRVGEDPVRLRRMVIEIGRI